MEGGVGAFASLAMPEAIRLSLEPSLDMASEVEFDFLEVGTANPARVIASDQYLQPLSGYSPILGLDNRKKILGYPIHVEGSLVKLLDKLTHRVRSYHLSGVGYLVQEPFRSKQDR